MRPTYQPDLNNVRSNDFLLQKINKATLQWDLTTTGTKQIMHLVLVQQTEVTFY